MDTSPDQEQLIPATDDVEYQYIYVDEDGNEVPAPNNTPHPSAQENSNHLKGDTS